MLIFKNSNLTAKMFHNSRAWHNKFFLINFFISFTVMLFILGEVVWAFFSLKGEFLSLHYSIYFGVDWVGDRNNFFVFGFAAVFIFFLNYILANMLFEKKQLLSYFLMAVSSFVEILIFITLSLIIYINLPF